MKFCPKCGTERTPNDRFCRICGFDTQSQADPVSKTNSPEIEETPVQPQSAVSSRQPSVTIPAQKIPEPRLGSGKQMMAVELENLGRKSGGNKKALLITSALAVLLLAGGGLYSWFARENDPGTGTTTPSANQNKGSTPSDGQQTNPKAVKVDLTRAATYLSEPGMKSTFYVNYPDGTAGVVERVSGQVVPNEAVRVSEVETGVDQGVDFGYGFHYVERTDGTYYILDQTPNEIMPVLKNNLTVGQTWNYRNESGQIIWTVVDVGVDLNLGFTVFEDCLLVKEDNQMAEYQSITYYAPGRGIVLVVSPNEATEYYKMTALEQISLAQAAETIINWCSNYNDIKDDRTQNY